MGKSDPEVLDVSLEAAMQEFRRMEGIVQELLMLTRAETDLAPAPKETIKPFEFVRQSVERFASVHPDVIFKDDLHFDEAVAMEVVPHELEQILLILLDNAVKYSTGRPVIWVEGALRAPYVEIKIKDSGIGIPAKDLPHVFDRFYRVDKARTREQGGSGLGLAIAKRLVERNGGQISISSVEHQGTTVTLRFPKAVIK
ncbi:hypothetical protein LJK88_24820 [Paenibacillus sp. P26]|nr:hypothetical protein LJK88_24820 [Paenibacillus sp. P26]